MTAVKKLATYDDLLALPEGAVGQLIDGELHAQPRPGPSHANASSALGADLDGPFRRGRGGPGGCYALLAVHSGDEVVHAAPFAAHGVALAALWNW